MKLKKTIFTTGLLAISVSGLMAQGTPAPTAPKSEINNWSIGINFGQMQNFGDIHQYDFFPVSTYNNEWRFGYGLTFTRSFNHVFGLQGQILNGQVAGVKRNYDYSQFVPGSPVRGVFFEADVFEYSLSGVFNLSNLTLKQSTKPRKFAFYASLGLGLSNFKTTLTDLKNDTVLYAYGSGENSKGKGTKRTTELVIPIGLGIKYKINSHFDLGFEASMRMLNSDKLDIIVDKDSKDKYSYTSLSLTYKFGENADAKQWTNPLDVLYADNATIKSKIEGLSSDQDKDGVSDIFDKDNTTPEGVKVYGDGTTVDTDGDGVSDLKDTDPFSLKGAKVDAKGKELDTDNDGVADSRDLEPSTAQGALVNFQGKTIPATSASSEVSSTGYLPSIYFASGSALIQYKYYESLAAIAKVIKSNPGVKITIIGNTDEKGPDKINEVLGQKRAQAVADHLTRVYGIAKDRVVIQSKGKSELIAKGADGINRRVDFKVSK